MKLLRHPRIFRDPMDCSPPGSSVYRISQEEYWSGFPFPAPGDLPNSVIEPTSPALPGGFFTTEPSGKPKGVLTAKILVVLHNLFSAIDFTNSPTFP